MAMSQIMVDPACNGLLDGFVAHETDPDKYYECSSSLASLHTCQTGHVWDDAKSSCLLPLSSEPGIRLLKSPGRMLGSESTSSLAKAATVAYRILCKLLSMIVNDMGHCRHGIKPT